MPVQPHPTNTEFDNKDNRINYVNSIRDDAQVLIDSMGNLDGLDAGYAKKIIASCTSLVAALEHFKSGTNAR